MLAPKPIRYASLIVALLLLAACGTPQTLPGFSRNAIRSAIPPSASSGDLIYATGYSDAGGSETFMLSYPQGQLVGSIPGPTEALCSDTNGNVYLMYRNAVTEYAHGSTTPIRTLRIPGAEMYSCSVDPSSNDLAVIFSCPPCGYQNLAIFPNGSGTPTRYTAPYAYTCGYDDQGNLFLGGYGGSTISELPKGSGTFTTITLSKDISYAGQLQWDGTYITLQGSRSPTGIYRIQVSGSTGTVVGETKFSGYMRNVGYSSISVQDAAVIMPFSKHGTETDNLGVWKYPRGRHAVNVIKKIGTGDHGFGSVAISVAPH